MLTATISPLALNYYVNAITSDRRYSQAEQSNGDAPVIYPLLEANTDKLNHTFADLLRLWATNTLAELEADAATCIAAVISNFMAWVC
ncbi:hypothetical protein H1Q63_01910 [Desmonostoc muscorum CCALA 125]|nr:hypothetical protein [Desmonostoc muscorum CCALA 125]